MRQQCPADVSEQQAGPAPMTLSERVRNVIARVLVEGNCTCKHVAAALGLHPRTLQRRLRQERESFESIKDSVRRDVALRYLRQPNVSLVRVTEILGYSETSVLSRSCHRWFATSPRRLRNDLSRLAPAEADAFGKIASRG
jgi:AraC-like DNA-binding protein